MSLVQEVLYIISNYPGGYRLIYDFLYDGLPPLGSPEARKRNNTVRVTLSRLKRRGLLANTGNKWKITPEGKKFLQSKSNSIKHFFPLQGKRVAEKRLIVAFDIPEKKRIYRDWLRVELIGFGFEQVQKSVWFGPALPKEFLEYLHEIRLLNHLRFFKASREDLQ